MPLIKGRVRRRALIYVLDAFLIGVAMLGVYRLQSRGRMPADMVKIGSTFVVKSTLQTTEENPFEIEDELLTINGLSVFSNFEIEFLTDQHKPGDTVEVAVLRAGEVTTFETQLIPHFSMVEVIAHASSAALYFALGILVLVIRRGTVEALVFHWIMVLIALMIMGTWASYDLSPAWLGHLIQMLSFAGEALAPALGMHFSFIFPRRKLTHKRLILIPYGIGAIVLTGLMVSFLNSVNPVDIESFRIFLSIFVFSRWILVIEVLFVFGNMLHSYITALEDQERRKIMWVGLGIILGPVAYALLWTIPQIVLAKPLISVSTVLVLLAFLPITFTIAIIRHQVLDVVLLFNRSTAATLILGALLAIYALIVGLIAAFVQSFTVQYSLFASGVAAGVVVLIFEPTRRAVTLFVDRTFFRTRYHYRESQQRFIQNLPKCVDTRQVAKLIMDELELLLEPRGIAVYGVAKEKGPLQLLDENNFAALREGRLPLDLNTGLPKTRMPLARIGMVEMDAAVEEAPSEAFRQMQVALAIPLLNDNADYLGVILIGEKQSGAKYTRPDIVFLQAVGAHTALAFDHILLQGRLLLERAETQRLEELNQMKSYFVSSVSHDLKTPLTSIRLFAEMMGSGQLPQDKVHDYCRIIEGESDRLTRLINNVLDFAKIEKGIKEYSFTDIDLNRLVEHVMQTLEYQFEMNGFLVERDLTDGELVVNADADAVTEVLVNLLANSMKYFAEKKIIKVVTFSEDSMAVIKVVDQGIGISPEKQAHIFDPFYRAVKNQSEAPPGTGLGLSVVKHVMEAHHGEIDLKSELGKGSTFILLFPTGASA